jgi:hypothetical protein
VGYLYGNGAGAATASTTLPAASLLGVVAVANGGTNASTVSGALAAFGLSASGGAGLIGTLVGTVQSDLNARPTSATLAASGGAGLVGYSQGASGSVSRTLATKEMEIVSIGDFGATPLLTDATTEIQNALNCGATAVFVPQGEFTYSALTMPTTSNFVLYGVGRASVLKQTGAGLGWPTGSIAYTTGEVRNLQFDGTNGSPGASCINTAGVGDCDFTNIAIHNVPPGGDGIYVNGTAGTYTHDIRLARIFVNHTSGVSVNSGVRFGNLASDSQLDRFLMDGNFNAAVCLQIDDGAQTLEISNSHPYNAKTHVLLINGDTLQTDEFKFINCIFDNAQAGDVVSINNAGNVSFVGGRIEAVQSGYSAAVVNNCALTRFTDVDFAGSAGALSCVAESGGSSGTLVLGGSVETITNFSNPFNLTGANSLVRFNRAYNPVGASIFFSAASQTALLSGTTNYLGSNGSQSSFGATAFVMPFNGYCSGATFAVDTAPGAGNTITVNLVVNGSTVATGTISGASSYSVDIPYTGYISQGAQIGLEVVMSASAASAFGRGSITAAS